MGNPNNHLFGAIYDHKFAASFKVDSDHIHDITVLINYSYYKIVEDWGIRIRITILEGVTLSEVSEDFVLKKAKSILADAQVLGLL